MTWELRTYLYRYGAAHYEDITEHIRGLHFRSAIPGGLQTISFEMADNYIDAYRWATDRIGWRIYVVDNYLTIPVGEGIIFEPEISDTGNRVTVAGPWQAYCFSQVYNDTASWIAAGTTGAQIKAMLIAECPNVSTDQSHMSDPGTTNAPWQPSDNSYPGDLIPGLVALSDATNREWLFWLASSPRSGVAFTAPTPWLINADGVPKTYTCRLRDMARGGIRLRPSLRELANDVRAMWQDATGIQNQTASAVDATSWARFGLRERWDYDLGKASATAADQYRDMVLAGVKDPQQGASFRLNTRIYDKFGGSWPLWRLIADFPVKLSVTDLIPDDLALALTLDNKRTFTTLAADYDYDSNTLTVVPDTEDNRADAMMARHSALV